MTRTRGPQARRRNPAVSIGYPGPALRGRPVSEPHDLAQGRVGFDFTAALGCPVKLTDDASMQALSSYEREKGASR